MAPKSACRSKICFSWQKSCFAEFLSKSYTEAIMICHNTYLQSNLHHTYPDVRNLTQKEKVTSTTVDDGITYTTQTF